MSLTQFFVRHASIQRAVFEPLSRVANPVATILTARYHVSRGDSV
jgi:hypothetical protein